jgi:hypothetical protein
MGLQACYRESFTFLSIDGEIQVGKHSILYLAQKTPNFMNAWLKLAVECFVTF